MNQDLRVSKASSAALVQRKGALEEVRAVRGVAMELNPRNMCSYFAGVGPRADC